LAEPLHWLIVTIRAADSVPVAVQFRPRLLVRPRDVRRRDLLGGLIHEYDGTAA
jgi:hypothetical protein